MEAIRESKIIVKSLEFKEEDVKFDFRFRADAGIPICTERMNEIKSMGIDPANNCLVIIHEFVNEEGQ